MNKIFVGISFSSLLGALLGWFIFKDTKVGKGWGAVIGFFALPLIISIFILPFTVMAKKK